MDHGTASHRATTVGCARKSHAMDDHLAEWGPKLMTMLGHSRDAVARSRRLLDALNTRDAK